MKLAQKAAKNAPVEDSAKNASVTILLSIHLLVLACVPKVQWLATRLVAPLAAPQRPYLSTKTKFAAIVKIVIA